MKKLLLILTAVAAMVFTGCEKDGGNVKLKGTKWSFTDSYYDDSGVAVEKYTLDFYDDVNFTYEYSMDYHGETEITRSSGRYNYSAPNIVLYLNGSTVTGTVNKSSMALYFEDGVVFGIFAKN